MFKTFFKFSFISILTVLILSGCTISFNTGGGAAGGPDGGIFKTTDKGATWQQKGDILTVGPRRSMANLDIISLGMDPSDNNAIYGGSVANGLFYSYDAGESWSLAANSGRETVTNIAIDPTNKCVVYATATNRVLKSEDCNRGWGVIYFDTDLTVRITSLVIDHSNSNNIYIGTSRGEIIKSSNKGGSWNTLYRFNAQVDKIVINPVNPKNIFVGTGAGIFRTSDSGGSWVSMDEKLKSFDGFRAFRDLIMIRADRPTIYMATTYGLLKSTDTGETWSRINLITPVDGVIINSIVANPFDANEIYYTTNTTFYRSIDGGKNWSTRQLPTKRAGWRLMIDPRNTSIIYLAARQLNR